MPLLAAEGYGASAGELRRLVAQGGVRLNGEKMTDLQNVVKNEDVLKIGKKQFVQIKYVFS